MYRISLNGVAEVARTVADLDSVKHLIHRILLTGNTGEWSIGEGAAEVLQVGVVSQLNGNITGNTVAGAQLGDGIDFKTLREAVTTIRHENIQAVFIAQIRIAVGKGKSDD